MMEEARRRFLKSDKPGWLALNKLFPDIENALRNVGEASRLYILSTKKKRFIRRILDAAGVPFKPGNIMHAAGNMKLPMISRLLDRRGAGNAVMIDDQIDHLTRNDDSRIRVGLAAWGYVRPEWLSGDTAVKPVTLPEAVALIARAGK